MLTDSKRERVAEWNAPRRAVPLAQYSPHRMRNATNMFMAGPAAMTTIRFHGGCA